LENNYNLNITEKENIINKLQEERKKLEDILKVVNEEKLKTLLNILNKENKMKIIKRN
jgi:hypothetical protein